MTQKEKTYLSNKVYVEKIKSDPVRYATFLAAAKRRSAKYRDSHRVEMRQRSRDRRKLKMQDPEYREQERIKSRDRKRLRREIDPNFRKETQNRIDKWRAANKDKWLARERNRKKERMGTDLQFRLRLQLRARMGDALKRKGADKRGTIYQLLGCDIQSWIYHIGSTWINGMSWDNYGAGEGKWHADHIVPLAAHDMSDEAQQRKAFHYTNMQPLWADENMRKSYSHMIPSFLPVHYP